MRKFLSILLAAAMLVAVFGVNVLAAAETHPVSPDTHDGSDKEYWVVGWQSRDKVLGNNSDTDLDNGVETFPVTPVTSNIKVNFNTNSNQNGGNSNYAIQERYAIDIDYANLTFDLANISRNVTDPIDVSVGIESYKYVWNVNSHIYELWGLNGSKELVKPSVSDNFSDPIVIENAFKITNHSSLPIYYDAEIGYLDTVNSYMTVLIHCGNDAGNEEIDTRSITRCLVNGSAPFVNHNISAKPKTGTWSDVINGLASTAAHAEGITVVATLKLQFAMNNTDAEIVTSP